jgi:two-component system, NtrC family, response regulator PilR
MDPKIIGESKQVKDLLEMIERVASSKTNVLVFGESGTGKELVARKLHDIGPLRGKPFIPVNCGAIPETLMESEFFGHRRGSFTGAIAEKAGLFEAAHGGTLFLDEVGEIPLSVQVKLLRAIQERSFRKVGGNDDIRVDVRIIAATNRDLEDAVRKGTFREDLFYRLNVIMIKTPPLRDRKGDVPILAQAFLKKCSEKNKKVGITGFEPKVMSLFEKYTWPGNVRELENVVERSVTLTASGKIGLQCLPTAFQGMAAGAVESGPASGTTEGSALKELRVPAPDFSKGKVNLDEILGGIEKTYLLAALEHTGGVKKKAASLLGITFRSIRYRLNKLGVKTD